MQKKIPSYLDLASSVLLAVILFELMLGGGGRLTALGPISLRMVLFILALFLTALYFMAGKRLPKEYVLTMGIFSGVICLGWFVGWLHGSESTFWWEDVKPLCYFFMLPFFYFSINDRETISRISRNIQWIAILLSISFFTLLILIHTGFIPFLSFYHLVLPTQEFFFRGELTFFYKGFLYLSIGFIFIEMTGHRKWRLWIIAVALLLTFTRGFWFALSATYSTYFFFRLTQGFSYSKIIKLSICLALTLLILVKGQVAIATTSRWIDYLRQDSSRLEPKTNPGATFSDTLPLNPRLLGDRAYSDDSRWQQIRQVLREMNLASVFIGHGLGLGIPARPVHMEIAYLEIFHKQGLIGLCFWGYLLWILYRKFRETADPLAKPFFFAALFVFIQSLTNQYVNNPIGLSLVLLSLVCLAKLNEGNRGE